MVVRGAAAVVVPGAAAVVEPGAAAVVVPGTVAVVVPVVAALQVILKPVVVGAVSSVTHAPDAPENIDIRLTLWQDGSLYN